MPKSAKPTAVQEVENAAETAMAQLWAKLDAREPLSDEDFALLIEVNRDNRARWLIKQRDKGKEE